MTPSYCVKLILKLTVLLMFVFSTSSTKQCTSKKTQRDAYVIKNIGIKLCQLKCAENGQCLGVEYNTDTLTCRLSRDESKIKKKEGYVILARDQSQVPTGSCSSSMCSFGQRCLETRSGKTVCVQDEKQNYPGESPQHKVDKLETFANSPLQEACKKGDLHRVRQILSRGLAHVNIRDEKHGKTPLMVAAQEGHCSIFLFLIGIGANMSEVDNGCKNALHWACKGGHVGMRECVLQHYRIRVSARNERPLMQAVMKGYRDVVEFLVCTGSNVSQVDVYGNNVLNVACTHGHLNVVKYLLSESSVDINRKGSMGRTPLMAAVIRRYRVVVEFLVHNGANVSQVDDNGDTALHFACRGGYYDLVKHLLSQSSVDINRKGRNGRTPLMVAVAYSHRDVFEFLMRNGANLSQVDAHGNSVLHLACTHGHFDLVKHLLSQSSLDINIRGNNGITPLMEAAVTGQKNMFDFLVSVGANVSQADDTGHNILHLAALSGRVGMVKHILSQNQVDINARNKDGKTAAMIAKHNRKLKVLALLV